MFDMNYQANSLMYTQERINSQMDNILNQFTPGYKSEQVDFQDFVTGFGAKGAMTQNKSIIFEQGQIVKTQNSTDLAIEGNGLFVLNDGLNNYYSRDGRFRFQNGTMVNVNGLKVMGYELDDLGNITSEAKPISMNFDPHTKLYGGKYTGYHFDNTGKLFGERTSVDPLTGRAVTTTVPLYQVAVGSCANPSGLAKTGNTTFGESEHSGPVVIGTAGQGALGRIHASSLEMSSVDFAQQSAAIGMAKQNWEANFSAFKTMDKLRQSAIGLIR
jgi:flagellar hook protein FlgE